LFPENHHDKDHPSAWQPSFSNGTGKAIFRKKNMKRILVPCDFSKPAKEAFHTAVAIARKSHGTVTVLHVMFPQTLYDPNFVGDPMVIMPSTQFVNSLQDDAKKAFEEMKSSLGNNAPEIEFEIRMDGLVESIRTVTQNKKIEIVVMGTSGTSGLAEIFIGSNTERVVRFSKTPVLVIRTAQVADWIKNILLPTTGALDQIEFVSKVKELQQFFGAKLHVLYINTPVSFRRDAEGLALLREFARHYKLENYELHFKSYFHEDEGIIDFAVSSNMDMVAMATHARKGLSHLFLGSITEDVINHAKTSIWTSCLDK
jgi:nucleotide-binding universal stress UspA family protein